MKNDDEGIGPGAELRRRAEEVVRGEVARGKAGRLPEEMQGQSLDEVRQALHDLQVHQVELEMQNEELRRAQVELATARARYFDLYDLAPVGYVTLSEPGLVLEANLTAANLLRVARGELVKQPITRFIQSEDQDIYYLHRKQLSETGVPQEYDLRMRRAGNVPFWAHISAALASPSLHLLERSPHSPIHEPQSVIVISDITAHKQAEAERDLLEDMNRQLQKSESLGRMAGAIAHHFNNQLQTVTMNLEMALKALPLAVGKPVEFLTDALQATHRASEVSGLMLTYLGQTIVSHALMDLSETCRRNLPMLRAAMPKNVALETDLSSPGPVVRANVNQMQQVLTNLVTNAWEAGGGVPCVIRLSVRRALPLDVSQGHRFPIDWQPRHDAYACLEVADTGCGIAPEDIEKIFDPFFSRKFTGRGMGLAVVLGIVRAHKGVITLESEVGRGSTFRVYLPITEGEANPLRIADSRNGKTGDATQKTGDATLFSPQGKQGGVPGFPVPGFPPGAKVLLVEDDEMIRKVTAAMLADLGCTVLAVKDGVEAVELFRRHAAEIRWVLCDLTMPRMDGWETLTALRQIMPGIPVILASGYSEAQVMDSRYSERPQAFLSKPYRKEQLLKAIRQAAG